jgi:RimJ/RimL family protein N-acetyltransferase
MKERVMVEVRAATPADKEALGQFVRGLQPRTRRLRFNFTGDIPEGVIDMLLDIEYATSDRIVAVLADGTIVGEAGYVPDVGSMADIGFVVAERYQGHGIFGALIAQLAQRARTGGYDRFRGEVLLENEAANGVLAHWGAEPDWSADRVVWVLRLDDVERHAAERAQRNKRHQP